MLLQRCTLCSFDLHYTDTFGVTTASVVAVLGSAGLTLGLALQGSLSNFAGGVMILLMKPFKVGDYVIEDTNKNEGTVEEISLFYTRLKTIDNKSIVIPNGTLANNSMTNVTAAEKRRLGSDCRHFLSGRYQTGKRSSESSDLK